MAIDPDEVARKTMTGLRAARKTYETWSGYWWAPPEYVATVSIARAVHRLPSVKWVTMEHNTRETLKEARGGKGRPPKSLPAASRFDMVVWSSRQPMGVIEVKTRAYDKILDDVERVCAAITNPNSIRWGLVAYLYSWSDGVGKEGKDRVRDRTKAIALRAEECVLKKRLWIKRHCRPPQVEDGGAWTAEVLEIRL